MIISTNKCRGVLIIKLLTIIKEKPQCLGFPLLISGDNATSIYTHFQNPDVLEIHLRFSSNKAKTRESPITRLIIGMFMPSTWIQ